MIDPLAEDIITAREATSLYPRNANGKKVHISKIYRDMNPGVRGIRLESIRTPRLATSRQAVARFFARLSEDSRPTRDVTQSPPHDRRARQVEEALDRLGF